MSIPSRQSRGTSILVPNPASANTRTGGAIGGAQPNRELFPLPPLHLDAAEPTPENLQKQFLDAYEAIRRATISMRQNPFSAPSLSRNVSVTASPSNPQFVLVPHALGLPPSEVRVSRSQGAPWNGSEPPPGGVGYVQVTGQGGAATGGKNYTSPPKVIVAGGGGSGVTGQAQIENGSVVSVMLSSHGQNHTTAPNVTLVGGGGSGASAKAIMPPAYNPSTHSLHLSYSTGTYNFEHAAD